MATSDNVVRAGLTPKLRDVDTLLSMLSYASGPPHVLRGDDAGPGRRRYSPPFDEFELEALRVGEEAGGPAALTLPPAPGPALLLVLAGEGLVGGLGAAARGDVLFVPAGAAVELRAGQGGLQAFRAACSSRLFAPQG